MIVAQDETSRSGETVAWIECDCCGEMGDPIYGHVAEDLRTDNAECYICIDTDCPCREEDAHRAADAIRETLTAILNDL